MTPRTPQSLISTALKTTPQKTQSALPKALPLALTNFDLQPDSAYVRQPVVEGLFACSSATVWRMVKRGTLPAPRKLSERVTAWNVGQLRLALQGSL